MLLLGSIAQGEKTFPGNVAHNWFDAADLSTISVTGSSVTQWNDKGTAGYHLSQATGAAQPQSGTTTLNSLNVIKYDGGDVLTSTAGSNWKFLSDGTKYVIGLVIKVSASSDPENDLQTFSNIRRAEGSPGRNLQAESRGAGTGKLRSYSYNGASYVYVQDTANGVWTFDSPVVYTEINDSTNATAASRISSYFDTGSAIQTNTSTGTPTSTAPSYAFALGATDQALQGIDGYIAEFVIITGAKATDGNRILLRDYLKAKWAL